VAVSVAYASSLYRSRVSEASRFARYRVLPQSSSSPFSTSLDAGNAPIANNVQRSSTRTTTRTIGEVPIPRYTHTEKRDRPLSVNIMEAVQVSPAPV
jgi:hypothetical protein